MKTERILWIVVVVILLMGGIHYVRGLKQDTRSLQTMVDVMNDSLEYERNKRGEIEAERRSQNLTIDELKRNSKALGINNSQLRQRVKKLNNLVAYLQGELAAAGSGETELQPVDTVYITENGDSVLFKGHKFDWTNSYLSLNGTLSNTYKLNFDYTYKSDFEVTTYWKRPKPFKRKELVINMTFADPAAQAMSLNNVVVKPDPPKFWQTTGFKVGVGFIAGLLIGTR